MLIIIFNVIALHCCIHSMMRWILVHVSFEYDFIKLRCCAGFLLIVLFFAPATIHEKLYGIMLEQTMTIVQGHCSILLTSISTEQLDRSKSIKWLHVHWFWRRFHCIYDILCTMLHLHLSISMEYIGVDMTFALLPLYAVYLKSNYDLVNLIGVHHRDRNDGLHISMMIKTLQCSFIQLFCWRRQKRSFPFDWPSVAQSHTPTTVFFHSISLNCKMCK